MRPRLPDDAAKFRSASRSSFGAIHLSASLVFFRVYSRQAISKGDTIYNPRTRKQRSHQPAHPDSGGANARTSTPASRATSRRSSAFATCTTGDTLVRRRRRDPCSNRRHFPDPVISAWPSSRRRKWIRKRWASRSWRASPRRIRPSVVYTNEETGQTIIAGMGELHLEIICDRPDVPRI